MKYIVKERALKSIKNLIESGCMDVEDAYYSLLGEPSVDVAPIVRGEWIEFMRRTYSCSKCGRVVEVSGDQALSCYPYCHCGAKMN